MTNVVPYTGLQTGFLTMLRMEYIPPLKKSTEEKDFPSWLTVGRELRHFLPLVQERDIGNVHVSAYTCGCKGNKACPGWDMNPIDFLAFTGKDKNPWDSSLSFGEVMWILRIARNRIHARQLPSPLFFITEGREEKCYLLEVKRTRGRGFVVEAARVISHQTMIPRRHPLFLPVLAP